MPDAVISATSFSTCSLNATHSMKLKVYSEYHNCDPQYIYNTIGTDQLRSFRDSLYTSKKYTTPRTNTKRTTLCIQRRRSPLMIIIHYECHRVTVARHCELPSSPDCEYLYSCIGDHARRRSTSPPYSVCSSRFEKRSNSVTKLFPRDWHILSTAAMGGEVAHTSI